MTKRRHIYICNYNDLYICKLSSMLILVVFVDFNLIVYLLSKCKISNDEKTNEILSKWVTIGFSN